MQKHKAHKLGERLAGIYGLHGRAFETWRRPKRDSNCTLGVPVSCPDVGRDYVGAGSHVHQPLRGRNAGVRSDGTAGPWREAPRAEQQSCALGSCDREPYSPWLPWCWELPCALCARSSGECGLRTGLGVPGERAGDSVPAGPGLACAPTSFARVQGYLRNKPADLVSSCG